MARARAWKGRVLTVREDLAVFGEVSAILPAKVIMINPWNYNSLNRAAKKEVSLARALLRAKLYMKAVTAAIHRQSLARPDPMVMPGDSGPSSWPRWPV